MTTRTENTEQPKILVVDDNEQVRTSLKAVLEASQFRVTTATNVSDALHLIAHESFDVLLSDLHMPGPGDGLTVVSAMRHKNPDAVTLVFTGYPAMHEALDAILLQADEILVKPMEPPALVGLIREKLQKRGKRKTTNIERVASILERDASATITEWLARVEREGELTCVPLSKEQRTGHLPKLLQELVHRLRVPRASRDERGVGSRRRARQDSPLTRLFVSDDSRGISHLAGQHIRHLTEEFEHRGF